MDVVADAEAANDTDGRPPHYIEIAADVVAAYLTRNHVQVSEPVR